MIYTVPPINGLSPLFADAEARLADHEGSFDSIVPNIEHSIGQQSFCLSWKSADNYAGRLMYKTGETEQAIRLFLGLLKESLPISVSSDLNYGTVASETIEADTDKTFLEDFRLALEVRSLLTFFLILCLEYLQHFIATHGRQAVPSDLRIPFKFSKPKTVKIRLRDDQDEQDGAIWKLREESWYDFWRGKGKESLDRRRIAYAGGEIPTHLRMRSLS